MAGYGLGTSQHGVPCKAPAFLSESPLGVIKVPVDVQGTWVKFWNLYSESPGSGKGQDRLSERGVHKGAATQLPGAILPQPADGGGSPALLRSRAWAESLAAADPLPGLSALSGKEDGEGRGHLVF